jgi:hypothetical protein
VTDNPFDRLNLGRHDRLASQNEAAFEAGKVRFLLRACGFNVNRTAGLLARREAALGGDVRPTFRAFHDANPSFPLFLAASRLGGRKLHADPTCLLPSLLERFAQSTLAKAFDDCYERAVDPAAGRAVGLVVPRRGLRNGLLVHGGGLEGVAYHGAELRYTGGTKKHPHHLYVRPFQAVLAAVYNKGHGWRPEE